MATPLVLWDDVPAAQRDDERSYQGFSPTTNRGCTAAVQWPDGAGWHRCASGASKARGLCRKHAERAGIIPLIPRSSFPRGLDNRLGNLIVRNVRHRAPALTVREFRLLSMGELQGWRNCGRLALPFIREVQTTWTDEELIWAFGLLASVFDPSGDFSICNWVGEAEYDYA